MDDGAWREQGFTGGLLVGLIWAAREFIGYLKKGSSDNQSERRITALDVREDVRANAARLDAMNVAMAHFQTEEARIHGAIEAKLDRTVAPLARLPVMEQKLDRILEQLARMRASETDQ